MRIWTLFLIKVMPISDHWSTGPSLLHFKHHASTAIVHGPSWLPVHFEPPQLSNIDFDMDPAPDPALDVQRKTALLMQQMKKL